MSPDFVLSHYIDRALCHAEFQILEDGTYGGRIPPCLGVVAFGNTLRECEDELYSVLEDWIIVGLRFGDEFPIIDRVESISG
jgi:predicted RNase H-like HicB family nuclease